jgi:murein DD-endopeptidase MepM/ murein hydrolase activator NlpD
MKRPGTTASLLLACVACGEGGASAPTGASPAGCGPYPAQEQSPYVLPYAAGTAHVVSQGNCTNGSHSVGSQNQYAYDFRMPIGTGIVAARSGTVSRLVEEYQDGDNTSGHENQIWVRHGDGTAAAYLHLTRDGALLEVGDSVSAGQVIALSGNTGASTEPHLHFAIVVSGPGAVPTTFRNTRPHPNGLAQGEPYSAE